MHISGLARCSLAFAFFTSALVSACSSSSSEEVCDMGAGEMTSAACDALASKNGCSTHSFVQRTQQVCVLPAKTGQIGCCDVTNCHPPTPTLASACSTAADAGTD